MRLLWAELLKIRRRWATYIVLGLLVGLMALIYVLIGFAAAGSRGGGGDLAVGTLLRFPNAYGLLSQFVFGLGGLMALCYAAAIGGADWNWGVFRVIIARGESRIGYVLTKFIGLAIALIIGIVIAFLAGILLTFLAANMGGVSAGSPFAAENLDELASSIGLGLPVILERAAIGYSVAMLIRSQLAGVIVGIALFFGEGILSTILIAFQFAGAFGGGAPVVEGNQWYQFLPFSIGDSVLAAAPGLSSGEGGFTLAPVPLGLALVVVFAYMLGSLAITSFYAHRTEITA